MSIPCVLSSTENFIVVVPAAGVGKRMLSSCPKQYLTIDDKTILNHTVERLLSHKKIEKVVLALSDDDGFFSETSLAQNPDVIRVSGGAERVDSVLSGLQIIDDAQWVLVHDAARPCVTHEDIDKLIEQCIAKNQGGILAAPVVDTMKLAKIKDINEAIQIDETIDRSRLWHAFTPQMFNAKTLKQAIEKATMKGVAITDEASAIEALGLPCMLVSGRRDNIKITRPEDLVLAEFYLKQQAQK